MNLKSLSRIWPLACTIAIGYVAFESTTLHGQNDDFDQPDLVFDQPATSSRSAVRQAKYPPNDPPGYLRSGRPAVQQTGAASMSSPRVPIPGTEPKSPVSGNVTQLNGKKLSDQVLTKRNTLAAANAAAAGIPTSPTQATPATTSGGASSPALASPAEIKRVTPTGHYFPTDVINRDGGEVSDLRRQQRKMVGGPIVTSSPGEQGAPGVRGAMFGLTGQTATERLYQMQTQFTELQRENDELRRENAAMMARVKEREDQLVAGVREIQSARRELIAARGDLERLRTELQNLREKVRLAEKEHSAVLQTIGPILQQLLDADEVSSLPPNPVERD